MNFQQILALLIAKFSGVQKDGLEQMARTIALQCTNEEEAKSLVEKITDAQVNDFVKEYRKVVDKEVSEAGKTLETNLKKKFDFVEKKTDPEPGGGGTDPKPDDIATIVANAVAGAVKPLQDRLEKYEQGEVGKSRLQALQDKLSACKDETFKAQTLKDFGRMRFDDDNSFNEYLTEKEADIKTANQSVADAKLSGAGGAPQFGQKNEAGVSKAVSDFIASQKPDANALTGKEV
ncbi:hypothetical protein HMPREF1981_02008 [Bacteroides pyogenes F0041]|uniref:Uncharacterized protein n=1 Tax=Bacteroides pyogenes F0041 TaxID=1321819 RepID=U2DYY5_9BACE|nr:hypothetical protein [Bacteroides pyogenes]ERI85121.1 hypothetical protein HMPREF1981_02008 [Bacteroides pyogenes F0041]